MYDHASVGLHRGPGGAGVARSGRLSLASESARPAGDSVAAADGPGLGHDMMASCDSDAGTADDGGPASVDAAFRDDSDAVTDCGLNLNDSASDRRRRRDAESSGSGPGSES